MRSSYSEDEIKFLLNDVTGLVPLSNGPISLHLKMLGNEINSIIIRNAELPKEYISIVKDTFDFYTDKTAQLIGTLAENLYKSATDDLVLVSIVGEAVPIGILVKRYLKKFYNIDVPLYAVSLLKKLDTNAMYHVIKNNPVSSIRVIGGWYGDILKGFDMLAFQHIKTVDIGIGMALLSDPSNLSAYCATHDDVYIPFSAINSLCTGLVSNTINNQDYLNVFGYHSAAYLSDLEQQDMSGFVLEEITNQFVKMEPTVNEERITDYVYDISHMLGSDRRLLRFGVNAVAKSLESDSVNKLYICGVSCPEVYVVKKLAHFYNIPVQQAPIAPYKAVALLNLT